MKDSLVHSTAGNSTSTRLWLASGPLLTAVVLVAVELFHLFVAEPPYPLPIFLLLIVYSAMSGGLSAGLLSALLTVVYTFRYFAEPGSFFTYSDTQLQQLISNVVVMPVTALLVGALKMRADYLASGELRASENRFQATFEQAAVGIAHVALDGRWLRVNERLCEMLGYSRQELLALRFQDVTHPDDHSQDLHAFGQLVHNETATYTREQRYVRKDRQVLWTALTVSLVRTPDDQADYCIAVISDIMAQKRVEAALRESELRYRRLFEANPEAMWVYDRQTLHFLEANDAAVARYGYSKDEFRAMTILDLQPAEDLPRLEQIFANDEHGRQVSGMWRHRKRDGTLLWVDIASHALDLDGREAVLVLATDITERRAAELALAAEKERLSVTLRSLGEGVITTDTESCVVLINPAAEKLTGWTQSEATSKPIDLVFPIVDEELSVQAATPVSQVLQGGQVLWQSKPLLLRSKSGTVRLITHSSAPVRDQSGQIIGAVLVFRDITDQTRMEQQLQQAQKMESIGLLAGGIAHDFNNLLTGIIGMADLALFDIKPDEPLYEDLENIRKQGQHGAALTKQLLAFSRQQILEPKYVNLNAIVGGLEHFIRRVLGAQIELIVAPEPQLAMVYVDPVQIEQVLLNLCINARDAMPHGGQLHVSTANVQPDDAFGRTHPAALPGMYVQLTVRDTGLGMDQETLGHIFEPFFTTKESGKGTGLGLAMVYGIIRQHNGLLEVESVPGQGSAFTIMLPAITTTADTARLAPEAQPIDGTETILIVEAEELVRNLMARCLERHGYATLTAVEGMEAVEILQRQRAQIDLVVLDVMLPKQGSRAVYEAIRALKPGIKILLVGGSNENRGHEQVMLAPELELLHKPFDPQELVHRVRTILDHAPKTERDNRQGDQQARSV